MTGSPSSATCRSTAAAWASPNANCTHVQHVLTSLACNVTRIADWITDPTRPRRVPSHFRALCTTAS
ncbi:hypothetical protein [Streptacidiphilus cavernicola]|uniref:Uncharacterized protein n=1 Tax=Streptacidiphilus cavernicola TaxID=3342716 RepID=A0ABV6VRF8_9ACTN